MAELLQRVAVAQEPLGTRLPVYGVWLQPAQRERLPRQRTHQRLEARVRGQIRAQRLNRFAHLQRVADRVAQRLAHVGQHRVRAPSRACADAHERLRQLRGAFARGHKRACADLHIEQDVPRAARELLAHDAGGNQRDALHRRCGVAQGVEQLICRRKARRLTRQAAANPLHLCEHLLRRQFRAVARNAL